MSTDDAFADFERILALSGPREALASVLKRSAYRFIGIFRFQDGMASAAIHYDRDNPDVTRLDAVPESATYCCYVRDSRGMFTTVDALADERLDGHVARAVVRSYCGIPIMDPEGVLLGTLCHYDVEPRDSEQLDLPLLLQVASTLARGGHVPPYPTNEERADDAARPGTREQSA